MPTDDPGWSDYIELPDLPPTDTPGVRPAASAPASVPSVPAASPPPPAAVAHMAGSVAARRRPPSAMIVIVAVVVVAAAIGGIVALTGGSSGKATPKNGSLTDTQWASRANAICRKYSATLTDAAVRGDADTYAAEGQAELAEFRALGLPPTNAGNATTMLTFLDQAINDVNNGDFQAADAAAKSAVGEATALHLTDCVSS